MRSPDQDDYNHDEHDDLTNHAIEDRQRGLLLSPDMEHVGDMQSVQMSDVSDMGQIGQMCDMSQMREMRR